MAKKRSPAHPAYGLEDSIQWAKELFEKEGEHYIPMDAVALVWNASAGASSFQQRLSSLKQYGLLEEKGSKDDREFKLTELALDIFLHQPEEQQRKKAISTALLKPPIHQELIEKYDGELPPQDASVRSYLLRGRNGATFNVKQVDGFVERFRSSIEFSSTNGMPKNSSESSGDTSNNGNGDSDDSGGSEIRVGSFVQWTSQDIAQFASPKKVVGIKGVWAFVEGSQTGIPMSELTVASSPSNEPPVNPFHSQPENQHVATGLKQDRMSLGDCEIVVTRPAKMTSESFEDLKSMFDLLSRNAERSISKPYSVFDE